MQKPVSTASGFDPIRTYVHLSDGPEATLVELRGRCACVVPRGVWHRGIVRSPSDALSITRGKDTEHRPFVKGEPRS